MNTTYYYVMGRIRTWTDEQLAEAVANSSTYTDTVVALGLHPGNKTVAKVRDRIIALGLDKSHFRGRGGTKPSLSDEELFTAGRTFTTTIRRRFLLLVDYECIRCGMSEWLGEKLILQLDHVDGDRTNNTLENLRLLCPNCHSQTETWSRKKQIEKDARTIKLPKG